MEGGVVVVVMPWYLLLQPDIFSPLPGSLSPWASLHSSFTSSYISPLPTSSSPPHCLSAQLCNSPYNHFSLLICSRDLNISHHQQAHYWVPGGVGVVGGQISRYLVNVCKHCRTYWRYKSRHNIYKPKINSNTHNCVAFLMWLDWLPNHLWL